MDERENEILVNAAARDKSTQPDCLVKKGRWSLFSSGRTGDSKRSRLLFEHKPSDHETVFVIMKNGYQEGRFESRI